MNNSVGMLVGGLLPALAFGIGALFQKHSNDIGIGQSNYLLFFAFGLLITSGIAFLVLPDNVLSIKAGLFAGGHGLLFGAGFVFLAIGLTVYSLPISQLVPLANMSTLVSVVFGLALFGEHTELNLGYLLSGATFIVIGGILVGRA